MQEARFYGSLVRQEQDLETYEVSEKLRREELRERQELSRALNDLTREVKFLTFAVNSLISTLDVKGT